MLTMLRSAIDDSGWKHAAIAAALDVEPHYLSRMLAGEKPWTIRHLLALPDDVETLFVKRYAESFGLIVVERVSDVLARKHLATGLFNILIGPTPLPTKTSGPIKADLASSTRKASAR